MAAPDDPIGPAGLAAIAAVMATGFGSQPDPDRRTSDAVTFLPRDWPEELPAKLTAWDAATQIASWVERTWDANGLRADKLRGLFGNPTFCPAKPVGNGLMPPDAFPVDVVLRRRCAVAGKGVVYEFDWVCACAGAGSGSGSGASGVLVACCPGAISATLTATFTVTAGACPDVDGLTIAFTNPGGTSWTGTHDFGSGPVEMRLSCALGSWAITTQSPPWAGPLGSPDDFSPTLDSCAPFHLTSAGWDYDTCPGATFTITITE